MDKAATELARLGAAKQANSDALVLQRSMLALGIDVTTPRLNDLPVRRP
jgi:hypothetical protein